MMNRDERRFKMADQGNDLKATKEEFTAFLHPEEYDHMKDIVVLVSANKGALSVYKDFHFVEQANLDVIFICRDPRYQKLFIAFIINKCT